MKRTKPSILQTMNGAEKLRIINFSDVNRSPNPDYICWGWCALHRGMIDLIYSSHVDDYIVEETRRRFLDESDRFSDNTIYESLRSILSVKLDEIITHLYVYSLEKEPIGVVFALHRQPLTNHSFLYELQSRLSTWVSRKEASIKSREVKRVLQTKLHEKERLLIQAQDELEVLRQDNRQLEKRMLHQRSHDYSTDMLNRTGLENALNASFNNTIVIEGKAYLSVILVQFTNGERVQARIGCEGLDQLLADFEQKVTEITSQIHYFARISTTELALATVVPAFDEQILPTLCKQIANIAKQGFQFHGQEVHLHTYMGVANSYHTQDANQLINNAFHAALACKESGELVSFFTHADQQDQKAFNQLEHYLLQAVRNDDLILYFQPKVELESQKWIGAEVLLRWKHPVLGDVSNEALIHMAEQNGLIIELGYFVLRNAIDRASEWIEFASDFCLSINISAKQICSPLFADKVTALLEQYELPPHNLELELTESCLVTNFDIAKNNMEILTRQGVKFALDDFGTGYASFNYLKNLPFHALKIDKEFLANILDNAQDKSILRSIITIAKKLEKQVVIEGVETQEQHQFVLNEHCDIGQGFYYAKPMPRDIFEIQIQKQYPSPTQFIIR
ncbi:putative bifunctional diguanylate cyclase/phosphodiesterase [Vibrio maritimus]|uniref:putative bifunctional diguanylate cyclase/phosphodiesterase n=1 Tax=Vibrio maritimus TaxID=990268 RepID=UPI004068011D